MIYQDGKYTIDFADFEEKILHNRVKAYILCSPHNPVCRVWTVEELQTLGSICKKHGVTVISDEIHCDFAFPEHPHTPFVKACPDMAENTVICTAPSKSFNLAGLQVSNIFVPGQALRQKLQEELTRVSYSTPNNLGAVACQAAYEEGAPWLDDCKAYMRENLAYVRSFLAERLPKIRLVEPEGTYFAWLDCTGLGMTKEELDNMIIHKAKLWLDSGAIFGECAAQFQRVVLACPRATVVEAMERLEKAING
jgi:cystathionine beta-lyase